MKRLLIIGSPEAKDHEGQALIDFVQGGLDDSLQTTVSFSRMDRLVYIAEVSACHVVDHTSGLDLADYDLVWFRGKLAVVAGETATVANYLQRHDVPSLNTFYSRRRGIGKVNQMFLLSAHNLPMPKTVSAASDILPAYADEHLSYPMIVKDTHGSHGKQNYLVHNRAELEEVLRNNPDIRFMAQECINGEGDYRILFAGAQHLIIHRLGTDGSHLNNTSQGAQAKLILAAEFPAAIVSEARRFADICEYEIAGVDVIIDRQNGQYYFLEINSQPQVYSGAFVDEKQQLLGEYFQSLLTDSAGRSGL